MRIATACLLFLCVVPVIAHAEVMRVDVARRADVAAGAELGRAGAYEMLAGTLHFAVDPKLPANQIVADIDYAPTNANGRVEFSADFYLLKPKTAARGNGALLFEVSNRGNKGILPMFDHGAASLDPTAAAAIGDGFLLAEGYTLLWVGWEFDPPPATPNLLRVYPPVATDHGAPLKGWVRSDFIVRASAADQSLGDGAMTAYAAANAQSAADTLSVRDWPLDAREQIARDRWQFARAGASGTPTPDPTRVLLQDGFTPNRIYEVVYESQNPVVAGLGLAAIRDAVTALKYDGSTELGIARGTVTRALAFGISQSGRVLRTFLYDGFNADERQRKVFDGVFAHIAGGARGSFNQRFAQPSRSGSSYLHPNELFPFTDAVQTDDVNGARDGLLAKIKPEHLPKIVYTNSSNEYWRGHAALTHLTPDGKSDLPPADGTRIYLLASTQHVPAAAFPPALSNGQQPNNPNDYSWFLRALLLKLDGWVTTGTAPPPSRYPTLAAGTLVPPAAVRFPSIRGVATPTRLQPALRLDYGPDFTSKHVITKEPPGVGAAFPILLPQVDADGNDIDGLRSPELAAPLGTYTGWSLYAATAGRVDELVSLQGSFIALHRNREQREQAGDPRPSLQERYRDRDQYRELVAKQARSLADQGYLRAEDLPEILRRAEQRWDALAAAP